MSILTRSLTRALNTGAPIARPKHGAVADQEQDEMQALRRMEEEEEEAQTLRRQEEDEEETVQTLRREEEEEEEAQARRTEEEEEELQALRRAGDEEEEDATVKARRQGEEETGEEETAQALRRAEEEEEEELQAMPASTDPEYAPPDSDLVDGEAPSDLRAQRVEAAGPTAASADSGAPSIPDAGGARPAPDVPVIPDPAFVMPPDSAAIRQPADRPRVSIDQIDVVIHEDGGNAGKTAGATPDFGRAFRARYLGGL